MKALGAGAACRSNRGKIDRRLEQLPNWLPRLGGVIGRPIVGLRPTAHRSLRYERGAGQRFARVSGFALTASRTGRGICRIIVLTTVLGCLLPGALAGATNATPVAYDVDPSRCTVEPRTVAELERIVTAATPAPPVQRPRSGPPIDPDSDTGKTVTSTIETLFACLNAGDRRRAYALYTDAYLATILRPGDLPDIATPRPSDPDEYTRIVAIDLHALENGGIIAKVTLDPALIPVHKIFEFILIPAGDTWRIDQVINEIDFSIP